MVSLMNTTTITTDQCWSNAYNEGHDYALASSQEITKFLHYVSPQAPKTALDIGCGTGQLTRELYHRGFKVLGIDASSSAIKIARSFTTLPESDVCYVQRDVEKEGLEKLPFSPYGLVTCKYVYAFIKNKSKLLDKVMDILDYKSTFIIISPLIENVPEEKKTIAIEPKSTLIYLRKWFKVEYYELYEDGFFICRNK